LAVLSLVFGLQSGLVANGLIDSAASAVAGAALQSKLALWHGINTALIISLASLVLGYVLYRQLDRFRKLTRFTDQISSFGPEAAFDRFMLALVKLSKGLTLFYKTVICVFI